MTPSPVTSTLRQKGAEMQSETPLLSSKIWGTNSEKLEQKKNTLITPNSTIRANPHHSARDPIRPSSTRAQMSIQNNDRQSRHETADQFPIPGGELDKRKLHKQFDDLALSPEKTIQSYSFASKRDALGKSTRYSCLRPMPGMRDGPARDVLDGEVGQRNKSVWDADDGEFENWPGQDTLNHLATKFTFKRDCLSASTHAKPSNIVLLNKLDVSTTDKKMLADLPIYSANLTSQEYDDLMDELADRSCGNPYGMDAHDQVMQQFFSDRCKALPASRPIRHMHIVDRDAYLESKDSVVQSAFPRLCDAVATVLYLTNPNCLQDFLNPRVKIFEWRRDGRCLLIRRDGNKVIVGTFLNLATLYRWGFYVRCTISDDGKWTETYAAVTQGTTPVMVEGVQFDRFSAEPGRDDISPSDPKWALHVGREMAFFLLNRQVWDFRTWFRWRLEWETDGVVSNAKQRERDLYRRSDVLGEMEK